MSGSRREIPNDPGRRDRILDAALDVIAEGGVHRTTHRKIASRAGVPLGSLTYYFNGMDDLLALAFARLAETMSQLYRRTLHGAGSPAEAEAAVVELICGPAYATERDMTLIFEMYAYANHNTAVAATTRSWLRRSRESLALHFTPGVARALDALIEGWPMHRRFDATPSTGNSSPESCTPSSAPRPTSPTNSSDLFALPATWPDRRDGARATPMDRSQHRDERVQRRGQSEPTGARTALLTPASNRSASRDRACRGVPATAS
ncbi:TetR/AcrR family transcriptional regulator [Streptomyces malaysiensis subsp. malaysiensis]